jgi:DNA mismatch endonuclease (patch repair protein)
MKQQGKAIHVSKATEGPGALPGNTRRYPGNTGDQGKREKMGSASVARSGLRIDVFTPTKRSAVMARIRGSGNKDTELRLIAVMRANGITGWRRGAKLRGRPDFTFPRERLAVFVDGCFWHGCPQHATWPRNNADFWRTKILGNQRRDRAVSRLLTKSGWRVVRIWEHALTKKHAARTAARLKRILGETNQPRM